MHTGLGLSLTRPRQPGPPVAPAPVNTVPPSIMGERVYDVPGTHTFTTPVAGDYHISAIGGGADGKGSSTSAGREGGGAGAFAGGIYTFGGGVQITTFIDPAGGAAWCGPGATSASAPAVVVRAAGAGENQTGGTAAASLGQIVWDGGNGASADGVTPGGGGGAAGLAGPGTTGSGAIGGSGTAPGGDGGDGGSPGQDGQFPGGGGGGGSPTQPGGTGSTGWVRYTGPGIAPEIGNTLTCVPGTWTGSPTITRVWKRDGVAIGGATGSTYDLVDDDFGCEITVTETANGTVTATSDPTDIVALPDQAPSLSVALQRSLGLLWQDTGKTVAATADGDPVRVVTCPWTGEDYTAPSDAARPLLYDEGDGKWSLSFDGVDDRIGCGTFNLAATGSPFTVSVAYLGLDANSRGAIWKDGNNGSTGFGMGFGSGNMDDLGVYILGLAESLAWLFPNLFHVLSGVATAKYTAAQLLTMYRDGTAGSTTFASRTFNAATDGVSVGGYATGGRYVSGRVAGVVPVGSALSDADRELVESYLAALMP